MPLTSVAPLALDLLDPAVSSRSRWHIYVDARDAGSLLVARYHASCGGALTLRLEGVRIDDAPRARDRGSTLHLSGREAQLTIRAEKLGCLDEAMFAGRELSDRLSGGHVLLVGRRQRCRASARRPCPRITRAD